MTETVGWTVTDPDGAVLDSGPGITLTALALSGDANPEGA